MSPSVSIPKEPKFALGALINIRGTELSLKNSLANGRAPQKSPPTQEVCVRTWILADGSETARAKVMARDRSVRKKAEGTVQKRQYNVLLHK